MELIKLFIDFLSFRDLLKNDDSFYVPEVIDSLSTKRVLTTEFVYGSSLDKITKWDKSITNKVGVTLSDCDKKG